MANIAKSIDFVEKKERELPLVERIHQKWFDTGMSIDATAGNDTVRQQRLANITFQALT